MECSRDSNSQELELDRLLSMCRWFLAIRKLFLQASAYKAADWKVASGWFGAIDVSVQGSGGGSLIPQQFSRHIPGQNELCTRLAETIYNIAAQALLFLTSTAPEVCSV